MERTWYKVITNRLDRVLSNIPFPGREGGIFILRAGPFHDVVREGGLGDAQSDGHGEQDVQEGG
jgi:hypothetical protein